MPNYVPCVTAMRLVLLVPFYSWAVLIEGTWFALGSWSSWLIEHLACLSRMPLCHGYEFSKPLGAFPVRSHMFPCYMFSVYFLHLPKAA